MARALGENRPIGEITELPVRAPIALLLRASKRALNLNDAVRESPLPFVRRVGSGSKRHRELQGLASSQNRELDHFAGFQPTDHARHLPSAIDSNAVHGEDNVALGSKRVATRICAIADRASFANRTKARFKRSSSVS